MNKKKDEREHCSHCAALYGLENPRMNSIKNSENFIALTKDDPKKPLSIVVIPKVHKNKVADIIHKSADEAHEFIKEVLNYCEDKLKCDWKSFSVTWVDGKESISVSLPFTHLKTHAHAEIRISY